MTNVLRASLVALFFWLTTAASALPAGAPIRYQLDLRQPATHLVHVRMTIPGAAPALAIQFPAWNALYQIRDFVRNVQDLQATCDGAPLDLIPVDVDTWKNADRPCGELVASYDLYANEESVFSAILDQSHAFLNLAQVLFYLPSERSRSVTVEFLLPDGWKLATPLEESSPGEYTAANYDRMVDSPVQAGTFDDYSYRQKGAEYRVVVYTEGARYSSKKLLESCQKITATETGIMQDVPFHRYTFFFHFLPFGGGGMEHAYGTAIGFPAGRLDSGWLQFESTVAHEFFHLWDVKRIRPQGLEPVDYIHGNDTRDLWFSEGVTSTYEELALVRSGLASRQEFYDRVAEQIAALEKRPARHFESAELSGMDAWLEGYRDYFRPERSISYYNKGELLGFLLDLGMREASHDRASLDDFMRALNHDFAGPGRFFEDSDLIALAGRLTGGAFDAQTFFRDYVTGTRGLDYQRYLGYAGLDVEMQTASVPDWGFRAPTGFTAARDIQVESVDPESSAAEAGLRVGDVITSVNGQPLSVPPDRLTGLKAGQQVELAIMRRSRRLSIKFQLGASTETDYRIEENSQATPDQVALRESWLGSGQRQQ
ncbi:MAG TPA: PDZ domain-containing protein [Terriglobia bacterium]|nr:PDZ domain-containing protein [Terriglobia bacterium]